MQRYILKPVNKRWKINIYFAHKSFYFDGKYVAVAIREPIGSRVNISDALFEKG